LYDLIIVGAGPAGITASVYAARKRMDFLVITEDIGGQAVWSSGIQNYTGYQFITGIELGKKFKDHLDKFNVPVKQREQVKKVEKKGDFIEVKTDKASYQAKTVIIASGRTPRELGVPGEKEYKNRGVTYCATCDAPLFAGMEVAVVGGGNAALDAVLQLVKIAQKVHLLSRSKINADPVMLEKARSSDKVVFHENAKVVEIYGSKFVEGIKIEQKGLSSELLVKGVFIEIGSEADSGMAEGVEKNGEGEIVVNRRCETNIPGIFAAGDVTNVFAKQIIVACGEGSKAALAAFEYLSKTR
jgi:thioredoxin-disulfide reductase